MRRLAVVLAVATQVLVHPGPTWAQRGPGGRGPVSRQEMLSRIQTQFQEQLARELALAPDERSLLAEVLRGYAETRADILPRRMELQREIRRNLTQGGSQQEARRLIDEVRALREREEALMVQEEERLLEFLQPSQVLLLQYLRDQFGNRIRRLGAEDGPVQLRLRGGAPPGGP